ncbi:MAG: VWA domain-containing protein [Gemmatimonadales bacterium]
MTRRTRLGLIGMLGAALLQGTACAKGGDKGPASDRPGSAPPATAPTPPAAAAKPEAPATLTDVNLVAADMGGALEELTGFYGPGLSGRRLIDGRLTPTWRAPDNWWPGGMYNPTYWTTYPQDIVLSFYERKPALIGAITLVVPQPPTVTVENDSSTAPAQVEVWTAMDQAPEHFTRVAAATLDTKATEQTVTFPATQARFVKLRLIAGATARVVEIAELRVLESAREGYVPLFEREPRVKFWKGSPRQAAQRGLDWLQQSAVNWQPPPDGCFGCHVQAQSLMGQAVALKQGYRVSVPGMQVLTDLMRKQTTPEGRIGQQAELTSATFGAMGYAQADEASGRTKDRELLNLVDYLVRSQAPDGSIPFDGNPDPPILQGQLMLMGNALVALKWAAAHSPDPKYGQAAERGFAWMAALDPITTQDRVFKIVTLDHYGTPDHKRQAWSLVEELAAQQQRDGGWKESAAVDSSNAFATGQVLYAFKQAGVSVRSDMFRRGVEYLLKTQTVSDTSPDNGTWRAVHTESQRKSIFAPTMWAVIGLAGSYGPDPTGALQVVKQGDKAARNLEIVLDVSGSMNTKLGEGTRWTTALQVLQDVVATLPEDLNVGLRVYGHRYPSKSAQTCQDTELLVPMGKLDRERLVKATSPLKPRGETPLVRSVLKTVDDLKAAGGGSVILITDGEESCKGNPQSAAREIKASGVKVTLNIVGFTLTGKQVETELGSFAASTGGQYYGAQDGQQLSRAIRLAALQHLPYDVLDKAGKVLASGESSELSRELPAGDYRVRIQAAGQQLEEPVTIVPDQTTVLRLGVQGDRFVIQH